MFHMRNGYSSLIEINVFYLNLIWIFHSKKRKKNHEDRYGIIFSTKQFRSIEQMKFTTEQQKSIAKYAIEHDNNNKATGEKYGISYQQVAAWVRKYKDELKDIPVKQSKPNIKKASENAANTKVNQEKKRVDESKSSANPSGASTLDVLSRRDPVLEKQLEDVKRRLGLIK